jgi:hypothetical protein
MPTEDVRTVVVQVGALLSRERADVDVLQPVLERAGWTPKIADWPKIVEAAKAGKSDPPGPRKRPATRPATR